MGESISFTSQRLRSAASLIVLFSAFFIISCCSSSSDTPSGIFLDSAVSGLDYNSSSFGNRTTDAAGRFLYVLGENITFSIGNLVLGSARGAAQLSPLSIVSGAADMSDQRVVNIAVLLQSLDADGDLNNGIQITPAIRTIVSIYASSINFNQTTDSFQADANVLSLLDDLNGAKVFTSKEVSGKRTLRNAASALVHLRASLGPRATVNTAFGAVQGFEATDSWTWKGIPFAKAPVGDLRFADPVDPEPWTGPRDAIEFGSACPQLATLKSPSVNEDCLYLNVFKPKGTGPYPVMVWIHGGAFAGESASMYKYDKPALVKEGVMVVSIEYRVGAFGFLTHKAFGSESGNYGLKDQVQALKWIQSNIANFGGDKNNVTIFGESAGGHSVLDLLASPAAMGLFHKAIVQSGPYSPAEISTVDAQSLWWNPIATTLGCTGDDATVRACMRSKSVQQILNVSAFGPLPTYGTSFLPTAMLDRLKAGTFNKVPVIIGSNLNEGNIFTAGDIIGHAYVPAIGSYYNTEAEYRGGGAGTEAYGVAALLATDSRVNSSLYQGIADLYLGNYVAGSNHRYRKALSDLGTDWRFSCNSLQVANYLANASGHDVYNYEFADTASNNLTGADGGMVLQNMLNGALVAAGIPYALTDPFSLGATHGNDIPYTFGKVAEFGGTPAQVALSTAHMKYLAQFARTGNPNYAGGVNWNTFKTGGFIMSLDVVGPVASTAAAFSGYHKCACWNGIFDNGNMNSCSY